MQLKYSHGALLSPKDDRDYQFTDLIAGVRLSELPSEYINPLVHNVPVVDQGQSETCVACSLTYLRWLTERTQSNNEKQFSPSYIYGNRDSFGYMGEGMIVREALQTLRKQGVCYYEDLPGFYDVQTSIKQYRQNRGTLDPKAYPFRISSFYAVNGIEGIKNAVYDLGGVIVSYPVYYCLYSPDEEGKIQFDNSVQNFQNGYHAMTIVGWTSTHWIVLNSWGKSWGKDGICYIPFSYPIAEAWGIVDQITEVIFKMAKFIDTEGHWAEQAIDKAADKGVVSGFEDGLFHPDEPITRAQLCSILDRLGLFN